MFSEPFTYQTKQGKDVENGEERKASAPCCQWEVADELDALARWRTLPVTVTVTTKPKHKRDMLKVE